MFYYLLACICSNHELISYRHTFVLCLFKTSVFPNSWRWRDHSACDLNARIGNDYQTWMGRGSHGLGNANNNGFQLLQFCNEHALLIGKTWFRQKNKYQCTWQQPRSKHWNMEDYIIFRPRNLQDIHIVWTIRGADCRTEHCLLRAKSTHKILPKPGIPLYHAPNI